MFSKKKTHTIDVWFRVANQIGPAVFLGQISIFADYIPVTATVDPNKNPPVPEKGVASQLERFFRTGDIHGYPQFVGFFRWSFLWWKELPIFFDGTALKGLGRPGLGLRTSSLPFTMCSPLPGIQSSERFAMAGMWMRRKYATVSMKLSLKFFA